MKIPRIFSLLFMLLGIFAFAMEGQAQGNSMKVPFAQLAFVPCADGGAGEEVLLEGTLHIVSHVTLDGTGGFHVKMHYQPQGAIGIGQSTGDTYNAVGVTQETFGGNAKGVFTHTFTNNFRLIGKGKAANFNLHQTFHVTINAIGEVAVEFFKTKATCK